MQTASGSGDGGAHGKRRRRKRPTSLVICVNHRFASDKPSCAGQGSVAIAGALEREIARRRIRIRVERIECLGMCLEGPSMRVAPGGRFFLGVKAGDIPGILDELEGLCGTREDDTDEAEAPIHLLGS